MEYRALEGFVFAVTPFNFTSIAGNLPTAPALMGNTVVWKPASSAVYSAWFIMELLRGSRAAPTASSTSSRAPRQRDRRSGPRERGARRGSTSPARPRSSRGCGGRSARTSPATGVTRASSARRAARTSSSPTRRADVDALVTALVRGSFEFQGQKCSAASRAYIPASLWPRVETGLKKQIAEIAVGDPADFRNFMGAVIDAAALQDDQGLHRFRQALEGRRRSSPAAAATPAGATSSSRPSVRTKRPDFRLMREEIFGPVLTVLRLRRQEARRDARPCATRARRTR